MGKQLSFFGFDEPKSPFIWGHWMVISKNRQFHTNSPALGAKHLRVPILRPEVYSFEGKKNYDYIN